MLEEEMKTFQKLLTPCRQSNSDEPALFNHIDNVQVADDNERNMYIFPD